MKRENTLERKVSLSRKEGDVSVPQKSRRASSTTSWRQKVIEYDINNIVPGHKCDVILMAELTPAYTETIDKFHFGAKKDPSINVISINSKDIMSDFTYLATSSITLSTIENRSYTTFFRQAAAEAEKYTQSDGSIDEYIPVELTANLIKIEIIMKLLKDSKAKKQLSPSKLRNIEKQNRKKLGLNSSSQSITAEKQFFIFISGFYHPYLPEELWKVGVKLTGILEIARPGVIFKEHKPQPVTSLSSSSSESMIEFLEISESEGFMIFMNTDPITSQDSICPSSLIAHPDFESNRSKSESISNVTTDILSNFWGKIYKQLEGESLADFLADTAHLRISPNYETPIKKGSAGYRQEAVSLFLHVSKEVAKINHAKHQYQNYISNIHIFEIEHEVEKTPAASLKTYNQLMNIAPPECFTVSLLLHCLVEEICKRVPDPYVLKPTGYFYNSNSQIFATNSCSMQQASSEVIPPGSACESSLLKAKPSKLRLKELADYLIRYRTEHSPLHFTGILHHRNNINDLRIRLKISDKPFTTHTTNLLEIKTSCYKKLTNDLVKINNKLLSGGLPCAHWEQYPYQLNCLRFLLRQNLLQSISQILNVSRDEAIHIFNIVLYEKLCCKTARDEKPETSYNQHSIFCGPTETQESSVHQLSETYLASPEESNIELAEEDVVIILPPVQYSNHPNIYQARNISTYMWYETLSSTTMIQQLEKARRDYICLDHQYCAFTDSLVMRFHNDVDAYGISNRIWKAGLKTKVGFRDFCKYIMSEEEEWLTDKENVLKKAKKENDKLLIADEEGRCHVSEYKLLWFDYGLTDFIGYNLAEILPQLPQLTGTTTVFHSQDGYKVTVDQTTFLGQPKRISLNVDIRNNNFILHYTKNTKEPKEPLTFHFSLADGTIIVFNKPPRTTKSQVIVGEVINKTTLKKKIKVNPKSTYRKRETKFFYTVETKRYWETKHVCGKSSLDSLDVIREETTELEFSDLSEETFTNINPSKHTSSLNSETYIRSGTAIRKTRSKSGKIDTNATFQSGGLDSIPSAYQEKKVYPSDINRFDMPVSHFPTSYNSQPSQLSKTNNTRLPKLYLTGLRGNFISNNSTLPGSDITNATKCPAQPTVQGSSTITITRDCLQVDKSLQRFILNLPAEKCDLDINVNSSDSIKQRVKNLSDVFLKNTNGSYDTTLVEEELKNINYSLATESIKRDFIVYVLEKIEQAKKVQIPLFKVFSSKLHKFEYVKCIKSPLRVKIGGYSVSVMCRHPHYRMYKRDKITKMLPIKLTENIYFNCNCYDLKLSLPTGLILNTISGINYGPFHIKQRYIEKGPLCKAIRDEDWRTFVRDGRIVIKKCDGTIDILCPNGQRICCEVPHLAERIRTRYLIHHKKIIKKRQSSVDSVTPVDFIPQYKKLECHFKRHLIGGIDRRSHRFKKQQRKHYKRLCILQGSKHPLTYTVITDDGKTIRITGSHIEEQPEKIFQEIFDIRHRREYMYARDDGTICVLNDQGVLITEFPDKTRITTWFTVEEELLGVNDELSWTSSDSSVSLVNRALTNLSLLVPVFVRDVRPPTEGWIDITIHYKFEHPNYASITYNSLNCKTDITLPNDLNIVVTEEGFYNVDIDNVVCAKITNDEVYLKSILCETCKQSSITTLNIKPLYDEMYPMPEEVRLLQTYDTYEKVFFVKYSGACCRNSNFINSRSNRINCKEHDKVEHQKLFAMNRDCSGVKYWDVKGCHKHLLEASKDGNSVIQYYDKPSQKDSYHSAIEIRSYEPEHYYSRFITSYPNPGLHPQNRFQETKTYPCYSTVFHVTTIPNKTDSKPLKDLVFNLSRKQGAIITLNKERIKKYLEQMVIDCTKLEQSVKQILVLKPPPSNFNTPENSLVTVVPSKKGKVKVSRKKLTPRECLESSYYESQLPDKLNYPKCCKRKIPYIGPLSASNPYIRRSRSSSAKNSAKIKLNTPKARPLSKKKKKLSDKGTQCDHGSLCTKKGMWERLGLPRPTRKLSKSESEIMKVKVVNYDMLKAKADIVKKLKTMDDPIALDMEIDSYLLDYCQRTINPSTSRKFAKNGKNVTVETSSTISCCPNKSENEEVSEAPTTTSKKTKSKVPEVVRKKPRFVDKCTATDNIPVRRLITAIKQSESKVAKFKKM